MGKKKASKQNKKPQTNNETQENPFLTPCINSVE